MIVLSLSILLLHLPSGTAWSKDRIEVSLATYKRGQYVSPFDRKFRVYTQPTRFYIILKNVSSSSQQIYDLDRTGGHSSVFLEMRDDKGHKTVISKKKEAESSSISTYTHIQPGEKKVIAMLINPDEWENVYVMEEGISRHFKVRVMYDNGTSKLYSPYYDVTFESGW